MKPFIRPALILAALFSQTLIAQETSPAKVSDSESPLYVKVQVYNTVKLSSLKPGDVTEGDLSGDVYSSNGKVFGAGSHVRLTVDHLERRRKLPDDRWPWIVKIFMPRHENFPAFKDAIVLAPDGTQSLLQVSLISAGPKTAIHIQQAKKQAAKKQKAIDNDATLDARVLPIESSAPDAHPARGQSHPSAGTIVRLEARPAADGNSAAASAAVSPVGASSGVSATLPPGTACRILLLDSLVSSKSRTGDVLRARLLEPVVLDTRVALPAGTLFEGKLTKAIPPRWLNRPGSLTLTFTAITLPDGSRFPIAASVIGVELNHRSHTKIDAEGRLRGDKPGAAWMLINGGVTAGIAKEVDDGAQLVIGAILSGATDASTAGTARIVGTVLSGVFLITRHGRDVVLPGRTEMDIMLNRSLILDRSQPGSLPQATTDPRAFPPRSHLTSRQ